jgi:molybdenum-dependent DNA-binding transcriptional regulator ModE
MDKYPNGHSPVVRLKARPCVSFEFLNGRITERELKALEAVEELGTQLDAARHLGITVPVLHRRLTSAEAKVAEPLVITDNRGTRVTELGVQILHAYDEFIRRTHPATSPVVACTPVTRPRVHQALNMIERDRRRVSVIVGDDETNIRFFISGQLDLIILDDPQFAYETFRDHTIKEVGQDNLLLMDRGEDFAQYRYGPQRLGFEYLKTEGIPYKLVRFISDIDGCLDSNLSFFLNENLALRKGMRLRGISRKPVVTYSILAVVHEDSQAKVSGLLKALTRTK